ncbi:hypothetical protein NPI31_006284 [Pseudomonas aeruginosa]
MRHLFWRLNFLLLSGATNSAQMYHEAAALSSELDTRWSYRSKELMTLYSKAKSYEAGERVEFGGKSFAPLYTPKNDTLINLFQISQQEQEQLKTIISTDEAQKRRRERDRLRDEERRRAAGQLEREAYEANLRIPVKLNSDSGICEHHFRKVCGQGFFEQKLSFEGRHLFDSLNKPAAKRSAAVVDPRRWNRTVHLTSEYVH